MHIEFADYLEAKFPLDERSLNADVRQACFERLGRKRGVLHCLDVGTGTGAMVRRLIDSGLHASFHITALDRDASLLKTGSVAVARAATQPVSRPSTRGGRSAWIGYAAAFSSSNRRIAFATISSPRTA
jgi:hypothetical protein